MLEYLLLVFGLLRATLRSRGDLNRRLDLAAADRASPSSSATTTTRARTGRWRWRRRGRRCESPPAGSGLGRSSAGCSMRTNGPPDLATDFPAPTPGFRRPVVVQGD